MTFKSLKKTKPKIKALSGSHGQIKVQNLGKLECK